MRLVSVFLMAFLAVSGIASGENASARELGLERAVTGLIHAAGGKHGPVKKSRSEYLGSCFPGVGPSGDPQDLGRAVQGVGVDEIDKVLYVTGNGPSGCTEIYAMRWSSDPRKRTLLGRSGWKWQAFAHQGTAVYRPEQSRRPRFFSGGNAAASPAVSDDKDDLLRLKLIDWDYRNPGSVKVVRSWNLFDPKKFKRGNINVNITPDQKQLIARAKRKRDNVDVYRVWDIKSLLAMTERKNADATESYVKSFDSAWGSKRLDGQAMAYDGRYVYLLASDQYLGPHFISIMDDKGRRVAETRQSYEGQDIYPQASRAEGEAVFFVRRHGKTVPVLAVYVQIPDPKRKLCLFFDISSKNPALR